MNKKKAAAVFAAALVVLKAVGELDRQNAIYPITDKAGDIIRAVASLFGIAF